MARRSPAGIKALLAAALVAACGSTRTDRDSVPAGVSGSAGSSGTGAADGRGGDATAGSASRGGLGGEVSGIGGVSGADACPGDPYSCTALGSAGTQTCGGLPLETYLQGAELTAHEGQRAVSAVGEATVVDGQFTLFMGRFTTCGEFYYRFDSDGDGKCSAGDDVRHHAGSFMGNVIVTEGALGDVASCAALPSGQDLAFTFGCFEPCDGVGIELLQDGVVVAESRIELAQPLAFVGKGLAGVLEVGEEYDVRYRRGTDCRQLSFVAAEGRNVVELDPSVDPAVACP